jgi:hypothetical protein
MGCTYILYSQPYYPPKQIIGANMTTTHHKKCLMLYKEMIRLYHLPYHEADALAIARELMTSDLSAKKMKDVEHVYFSCGGK